jgi:DNA-binding response OmpR family regulator
MLGRSGWSARTLSFPDFASDCRGKAGLAVVQWEALSPDHEAKARELRSRSKRLSLILTCAESALSECWVVRMLEAGFDDYLHPGTEQRLALAKVNAHLRRHLPRLAPEIAELRAPGGGLMLDLKGRQVLAQDGPRKWKPLSPPLTPTEFSLLKAFLERPGTILERTCLLESLWREEAVSVQQSTIDKHVESIRRKLGPAGTRIQTVYGSGYVFREAP